MAAAVKFNTAQRHRVTAALEKMPALCKRAFILVRYDGLTFEQAAAELRVSTRTVRRFVQRAFQSTQRAISMDDNFSKLGQAAPASDFSNVEPLIRSSDRSIRIEAIDVSVRSDDVATTRTFRVMSGTNGWHIAINPAAPLLDTICLMSGLRLIGISTQLDPVELALLPIASNVTPPTDEQINACRVLGARVPQAAPQLQFVLP